MEYINDLLTEKKTVGWVSQTEKINIIKGRVLFIRLLHHALNSMNERVNDVAYIIDVLFY